MLLKVDIDSLCLTFPLMNFAAESDTESQTMLFKVDIDSLCLTFPLMNFAANSDTESQTMLYILCIDRFYIALFPAFEQAHCARM